MTRQSCTKHGMMEKTRHDGEKALKAERKKRSPGARQRQDSKAAERFRDMPPSFKSYSMTNKLPLFLPSSHAGLTASWLPWWGGLPIATGGGVVP